MRSVYLTLMCDAVRRCRTRLIRHPVWLTVLIAIALPQGTFAAATAPLVIAVGRAPYSAPFYLAESAGLFKAEGVDVRLEDCAFGRICLERVTTGQADLATAAESPIVIAGLSGKALAIVATTATLRRDTRIITRRSGNVRSPADLANKKVGTFVGTTAHYYLHLAVLLSGGDPSDVRIVALKPDDDIAALLRSNEIEAAALFGPFGYRTAKALGSDARIYGSNAYTYLWNLVALPQFARDNEAAIARLLRALDRAMQLIQQNPAKAKQMLQQRLGIDEAEIEWSWEGMTFGLTLDRTLLLHLEGQARWALRFGYATGTVPDFRDYLMTGPLTRVRPESSPR